MPMVKFGMCDGVNVKNKKQSFAHFQASLPEFGAENHGSSNISVALGRSSGSRATDFFKNSYEREREREGGRREREREKHDE